MEQLFYDTRIWPLHACYDLRVLNRTESYSDLIRIYTVGVISKRNTTFINCYNKMIPMKCNSENRSNIERWFWPFTCVFGVDTPAESVSRLFIVLKFSM